MGDKLHEIVRSDGSRYSWIIYCPACRDSHLVNSRFVWNGSKDKPTFDGETTILGVKIERAHNSINRPHCHFSIQDGFITFYRDSSHHMAGETVELPDWTRNG